MIGGTPAAAAMRVSPAPCVSLKSSCLRSVPTPCPEAPAARERGFYARARPVGSCSLNVFTQSSNACLAMSLSSETTMFGVAPLMKNWSLCAVAAESAMTSRTRGVNQLMPRTGAIGPGSGARRRPGGIAGAAVAELADGETGRAEEEQTGQHAGEDDAVGLIRLRDVAAEAVLDLLGLAGNERLIDTVGGTKALESERFGQ